MTLMNTCMKLHERMSGIPSFACVFDDDKCTSFRPLIQLPAYALRRDVEPEALRSYSSSSSSSMRVRVKPPLLIVTT